MENEKQGPPSNLYSNQAGYGQEAPPQYQTHPYGGQPQGPSGGPVIVTAPNQYGAQNTVYVNQMAPQPYVNDYLGYSIFVTICCCWCIGIFAIIKSCRVRDERMSGNIVAAQQTAQEAKKLAHIALGVGIAITVLWVAGVIVRVVLTATL